MGEELESLENSGFFSLFFKSAFAIFSHDEVSLAWDVLGPGLKAEHSYFKVCRLYMMEKFLINQIRGYRCSETSLDDKMACRKYGKKYSDRRPEVHWNKHQYQVYVIAIHSLAVLIWWWVASWTAGSMDRLFCS